MNEQAFTQQQLFGLKKSTLEKRIPAYLRLSGDTDSTIQYLIALQIRDRLGDSEFHLVLPDLVQYLFKQRKITKTMRKFFFHFKEYFETKDWRYLNLRVFPVRQYAKKAISAARGLTSNILSGNHAVQVE